MDEILPEPLFSREGMDAEPEGLFSEVAVVNWKALNSVDTPLFTGGVE